MRKLLVLILALFTLSFGLSAVLAQDTSPIEYGQTIEGELTSAEYEAEYSFTGSEGDVIAITMDRATDESGLDATIILRKDGFPIATNDDFQYPLSLIVTRLPASGEYSILATRSGGATGSSEGDYFLKLEQVEPLSVGSQIEATLVSDFAAQTPTIAYLVPDEDGPVKVSYSQEISELYGRMSIQETPDWSSDPTASYYSNILDLSDTRRVSSAIFSVDLLADHIYVIAVDVSFSSYSFDVEEATVTVAIN